MGVISGTSDGAEAPGRWDGAGNSIEMDDLATQPLDSIPVAINSAGVSVGWAMIDNPTANSQTSAIRWDQSGHGTILAQFSKPGGLNAIYQPSTITDDGTIFGSVQYFDSFGQPSSTVPIKWDSAGNIIQLPSLGTVGAVTASNNSGYAVGYSTGDQGRRAVSWDAAGNFRTLGTLSGGLNGITNTQAISVNNLNVAVGQGAASSVGGEQRAIRWSATGTATQLKDPASLTSYGVDTSSAYAINDSGVAVGYADTITGGYYPIKWDAAGNATVLGGLTVNGVVNNFGMAYAINSEGYSVGYIGVIDPVYHTQKEYAVYWTPDGTAVDLNQMIDPSSNWFLSDANAITDTGWIAGVGGYTPDNGVGYSRPFSIQIPATTPEPSSLLVFTVFLGGLLGRRRARR